jgi:hypothetical protein
MSTNHTGPPDGEGVGADPPTDRTRIERLRAKVDELEAELERERQRRESVITQYERLLEEQRSATDRDDHERWDGDVVSLLLD